MSKSSGRRRESKQEPESSDRFWLVVAAMLLLAGALRFIGLNNDLWLDEIWSRRVAIGMTSALDTFSLHHEINHHLNTIWLYLVGPDGSPLQYRLPSFVCGLAAVAVAGLIGRRRSPATAVIAMLLTTLSYELVVFSSEARGYSMAVLCTLVAFLLLERQMDRPSWMTAAGYAFIATVGLFTQPVFVTVLAAACVWSAWRWLTAESRSSQTALAAFGVQLMPIAAFAALYFGDLQYVVAGGGTATSSLIDAFGQSLAWTLGSPDTAAMRLAGCVLCVAALDAGLRRLRQSPGQVWLFFLAAIVVFPNLLIILRGSELIYTRHFLLGSTLTLLLIAFVLGAWWGRGRAGQLTVAAVLAGYALTNGLHMRTLAEHGRGQYQDAIRFMAGQTPGRPLTIGGDQDFRVGTEVDYYLPRVLGEQAGHYVREGSWPPGGPLWVIANAEHYEAPTLPHNIYRDSAGNEYEYVRTYVSAPLSGLHWFLFRNRAAK